MPSRSTLLVIFILLGVAVLTGWNYFFRPLERWLPAATTTADPSPSPVAGEEPWASWSPELKVAQLIAAPIIVTGGQISASDSAWLTQTQPGFVTLFGTQISSSSATLAIDQIKRLPNQTGWPVMVAVDHEGGTVQRLNGVGFTRLPSWQSLCAQPATISAEVLARSAREIRAVGIDMVLAPMIDVGTSNPALGSRLCSHQPEIVAARAIEFIDAMQTAGVTPVLKHFPGLGQTTRDLHRTYEQINVDPAEASLYAALLDAYPTIGVMVSHVGVINQFPEIPCSLSSDCVGELRSNYPQALVISDALEMNAAGYQPSSAELKPLPERAVSAVLAGNELLIWGPSVTTTDLTVVIDALASRYITDPTFAELVDQRLNKIHTWRQFYESN